MNQTMRAAAFAVVIVAIAIFIASALAACGSAVAGGDKYRQDCLNNGGTYTEYEFDVGGACSYTNAP